MRPVDQATRLPVSWLFTLRLWQSATDDGGAEWRGKLQHVMSGESRYFRSWPAMIACLRALLPEQGPTPPGTADDPNPRAVPAKQDDPSQEKPMLQNHLSPIETTAQPADVLAIRELQVRQANAWNAHDAAAYAELFTADGDVVNVLGWWWRDRMEIERKLTEAFAYVFRDSTLTITEIDVRLLDAPFAVAHVRWTLEGAHAPPGAPKPPRQGIQLQVLRKAHDGWRIVSFQNTNSISEAPFPAAPPSA